MLNKRASLSCLVLLTIAAGSHATPQTLSETAKIVPPDGAAGDEFGAALVVGGPGIIGPIGAPGDMDHGPNSGSVYRFSTAGGPPLSKWIAPDGAASDRFGHSVTESGWIGAPFCSDFGLLSGAVYDANLAKVQPENLQPGDRLGYSVAGRLLHAAGAPGDNDRGPNAGAVYVFGETTVSKLYAQDTAAGDRFGQALAAGRDALEMLCVGAPGRVKGTGAAYLFDPSAAEELERLLPTDGALGDSFGIAVDLYYEPGDLLRLAVVGAPGDDDNGLDSGSAYVFDAATGSQIAKLRPSDGAAGDRFGFAVAIHQDLVLVGAPGDGDHGHEAGSAYLFSATTGLQLAKLLPSDGAAGAAFGWAVDISGTRALVGAPLDDALGADSGAVYRFDYPQGTTYCFPASPARLQAVGSVRIGENSLAFSTSYVPAFQQGIVYYGPFEAQAPFGQSLRCVGGPPLGRLPIASASAYGVLVVPVDFTAPPTAGVAITPGTTWHFQPWFRDPSAPDSFALGSALRISFLP